MATPAYRRPREVFGFSALPLPGTQNPMMSQNTAQRFQNAGLGAFAPYLSPWETISRAQDYRNLERDISRQDAVANAEDQFLKAIQEDPQTGYQKFIASNPLAAMSPMVRAYAVTQNQRRSQAPEDKLASSAAEMGSRAWSTFKKGRDSGKSDLEAFAEAVSEREKEELERKPAKAGEDDRLTLTGNPREEFDVIMGSIANTPEPTDAEKMAFLPAGKKEYSAAEWSDAYAKAKEKLRADAVGKLQNFQNTYGKMYQVPGMARGAPVASVAPQPASVADRWPTAAPTSFGAPQPAVAAQTPAGPVSAPTTDSPLEQVRETLTETPKREVLSISERKQPTAISPQEQAESESQVRNFFNTAWTSAKGELGKSLEKRKGVEKLADDPELLQSLFRSIQKGEAVLPQDVGLPKTEGAFGGLRPENPVNLLARVLGKDPNEVATFQVKEGGKKIKLVDLNGEKTWGQVIQAWADEQLQGTQGKQRSPAAPAFTVIDSQEAYEALPSGSIYRDSSGMTRRKK